ncbi:MAG: hypothetical protein QOG35_187 [Solirubrobacteraceae bacterium]|nr:hypothetical protein [Solirubrobacteraceae bacterium]
MLVLTAAAFDSPSLYVPGVALLLLGAGAALWVSLAASGAGLERTLGGRAVQEDQPLPMRLEIRPGLLPPPGGEIVEPLLDQPLPALGQARTIAIEARFPRRGRLRLAPTRLVLRDPLGLAQRTFYAQPDEVLVLPRVEAPTAAGDRDSGGAGVQTEGSALTVQGAALELDALRPYREGAPASRIHWPTVARSGEMMERRLVADADSRPLVVLDTRRPADDDALDSAVRAAASLAVHLARSGGCSLLLPGDRRASEIDQELRSWPPLHVRLALVQPSDTPPFAGRLERLGAIMWVTATPGAAIPAGLARAAAGARYLVTPEHLAGRPRSFTVAGCDAYRIGARGRSRRVAA